MARIVVTRPPGRETELVDRLRALGHEVVHVPLVAIEPLADDRVDVGGYDWVVVTSVVGARELRRRMRGTPRRVAAIGKATADAFGGADLVADPSTQEGLLAAMPVPAGTGAVRRRRKAHAAFSRTRSAPTSSPSTGPSSWSRPRGRTAIS